MAESLYAQLAFSVDALLSGRNAAPHTSRIWVPPLSNPNSYDPEPSDLTPRVFFETFVDENGNKAYYGVGFHRMEWTPVATKLLSTLDKDKFRGVLQNIRRLWFTENRFPHTEVVIRILSKSVEILPNVKTIFIKHLHVQEWTPSFTNPAGFRSDFGIILDVQFCPDDDAHAMEFLLIVLPVTTLVVRAPLNMMTSLRFDCSNPRLRICEIHASTQENVTMEQMRLSFFWIMGGLNKEDLKVRCFVNEAEMSEIPLYNSEFVLADGGRWLRVEEMRKFSEYLPWWHTSYPAMGNS